MTREMAQRAWARQHGEGVSETAQGDVEVLRGPARWRDRASKMEQRGSE